MSKPLKDFRAGYQLIVREGDKVIFDTGEFSNLIMSAALDYGDPFNTGKLLIGSGTTAPTVSDTQLENQLAEVAVTFSSTGSIFLDDNIRYGKRSVSGSYTGITGNVSEVGFENNSGVLFSRTIVRDGNGNPTIIPIQSHQTLDIIYYVYAQIPDEMSSGTLETAYGDSANYVVEPSPSISVPAGVFVGKYDVPFGSNAAGAMRMKLSPSGDVVSTTFSATFDTETQKTTVTINWAATATNREVISFEAATNPTRYPVITLDQSITLPADNDITLSLEFTRE